MTKLESLEEYASERVIPVYRHLPLDKDSCAIRLGACCAIALTTRPLLSCEQVVCLAHELGHCETGSFYNSSNIHDLWGRHEYRANKWAIKRLIPLSELEAAIQSGCQEVWELAEFFNVTEEFMARAIFYYRNGYIA